jgi:hypothetical protein
MKAIDRDERELAIDLAADRLAYLVLAFGVLVVVAYRGLVLDQASWELLALVIGTGFVGLAYRMWKRAASFRWALVLAGTAAVAAFAAVVLVLIGVR